MQIQPLNSSNPIDPNARTPHVEETPVLKGEPDSKAHNLSPAQDEGASGLDVLA